MINSLNAFLSGGDAGERIRNLRRKKLPLWLTVLAAVLCLILAGCLLTDREKDEEKALDLDMDRTMRAYYSRFLVGEDGQTIYFPVHDRHSADRFLYVLDVPSGIVTPLCVKPECRHNSSACNAWLGSCFSVQLYDGKIWFDNSQDVYRMDLDGRNRELVTTIDREFFFGETGAGGNIYFHRGYIFHAMKGTSIEEGEMSDEVRAYALPTDGQQEPEMILQKWYPGKIVTIEAQPSGDWFYIYLQYSDYHSDNGHDLEIYRWSLTEHVLETIYAGPPGDTMLMEKAADMLSHMWVEDNAVLFIGREKDNTLAIYALDIASGKFARRGVLASYRDVSGGTAIFGDRAVVCRRPGKEDWQDANGRWHTDLDHWDILVTVMDLDGNTLQERWITAPEFPELDPEDGTSRRKGFSLLGLSGDQLYAQYSLYGDSMVSERFQLIRLSLTDGQVELLGGWTREFT